MANSTVKDANWIKGTNPQFLIEKIIRSRILESKFWKEECFALSSELLVDKAMELSYIGGIHGASVQVTPFICLMLKMLQIQPEKDIVVEFIAQTDHKYVRALGAMYMRLTGTSTDCYKYLEPLYCDYKKLKRKNRDGNFEIVHMDEFIDELLREERVLDVILPRIQKRMVLEQINQLEPREMIDADVSDEELENDNQDKDDSLSEDAGAKRKRSPSKARSRSRSVKRKKSNSRSKSRERDRRRRDDDRERERHTERRRSRSRDRHHKRDDRERDRHGDKDRNKSRKERHRSRSKDRSRRSRSRERSRRRDDRRRSRRSRS